MTRDQQKEALAQLEALMKQDLDATVKRHIKGAIVALHKTLNGIINAS